MDILNELPPERFREVDDLLAFVSIYEDRRRTAAYRRLLHRHRRHIEGKVCVEAGCGFGLFSEMMANLGARKVYAVEQNPILAGIARERLGRYGNVEVLEEAIQEFQPPEPVDLLVHDFFGQLLYDEDLWALENLRFRPASVLPAEAELAYGLVNAADYVDQVVTAQVLQGLVGALVSGLFPEKGDELQEAAATWKFGLGLRTQPVDIRDRPGDLLVFGLRILDQGVVVCEAGKCPNWSYVWTPRAGDRFLLRFLPDSFGTRCIFEWLG
ncbi:MAG: hypothetical protein ONB23_05335 [candidate division KSB1 bacterium]|nr:hypothetical protein [candidate division KSB1 bacterium]